MKIMRKRWVVMRNNRTEIWGGSARNYSFKKLDDIEKFAIKTYFSKAKAESGCSSWDRDFEVVAITEILESEESE